MAYIGASRKSHLIAILKRTKDARIRAIIQEAYDIGHKDGYMQALEEVI